jgi:phosphatidylserine/phosphatidylglycerophosphate/cardiolipin synthase-like enzyme
MMRTLVVLPDDSARPIVDAIHAATHSLRVKMFVLSDPALLNALMAAHHRKVKVHVILNGTRRSGENDNERAWKALERTGIDVRNGNPSVELTHEKSMVVDDASAFVMSLNWARKNLTQTRDYAVVTTNARDVKEIAEGFDADWQRHTFQPPHDTRLIWCPGPGRDRICDFIDRARHRLFVQNERFQDTVVIERLVRAAGRGVKIHVMARAPHTLKREKLIEGVGGLRILDDMGIKVHKLKHLKLHGKMLLADGVAAIVGSINLASGSLDERRELAIEVHDDHVVDRLQKVAQHDWEHSRPLDLSDEGLLADLEDRIAEGGHLLALDGHHDAD